jgi:hypothetical protein
MTKGFVALTVLIGLASTGSPAFAGDKYVGKWDEQVSTSLEIISKTRVTYCYDGGCNRLKFKGTLDEMTFTFPKNGNFAGATMTMTKDGDTYLGEYELNGSSRIAVATLVKQ